MKNEFGRNTCGRKGVVKAHLEAERGGLYYVEKGYIFRNQGEFLLKINKYSPTNTHK